MSQSIPRVSIGLAVYNGAQFIEQAIDSILAQTFSDFELIISDNASTDATGEICQRYAEKDARVCYSRNETNIGGANNENRTFKLARGEYFRWAAHDDYCAPELISKCVAVLDEDPTIVLCYTRINEINENGDLLKVTFQRKGMAAQPHQRFSELAMRDHNCEATYGLIRSEILRKTGLQQNYTGSDRTLLCELSLYGKFFEIPEALFYKRYHSKNQYVDSRARMTWFHPGQRQKFVFLNWMQLFDYLRTIRRGPISTNEKFHCYLYMARWFLGHARQLIGDIFYAGYALLHPSKDPFSWRNKDKNLYNWE